MSNPPTSTGHGSFLAAPLGVLIVAAVFLPVAYLLTEAIPRNAAALQTTRDYLTDPAVHHSLLKTLLIGISAAVLCGVIATPLAFVTARASGAHRGWSLAFGLLPLATPPYIVAAMVDRSMQALGLPTQIALTDSAWSNLPMALIIAFALHYLPLVMLLLTLRLNATDRALQEAAVNLGGSAFTVLRRITLPLLAPAYIAALALVMLRIIEDVATPLIVGTDDVLAPMLFLQWSDIGKTSSPVLVSAALLLLLSALLTVVAWNSLQATLRASENGPDACPYRWRPGRSTRYGSTLVVAMLALLALTPFVMLLHAMIATPGQGVAVEQLKPNMLSSVVIGLAVAAGGLLLAGATGLLTRGSRLSVRALRAAITSLLAVPGAVLVIACVWPLGQMNHDPSISPASALAVVVFALTLKQLPYLHRIMVQGADFMRHEFTDTGRMVGMSRPATVVRYLLPAMKWHLWTAFSVGFVGAVAEASILLLMASDAWTPPIAIVAFDKLRDDPLNLVGITAAVLLGVMIAATIAAVFWVRPTYISANRGNRCE
ncbi:ABC transporter permease [Thiosocius teredinicola]|uniref:ABC transporter permease n=1 Tax=Thiosocius teredinicola TaxID=1973002 RepID=UPI00099122E5